MRNLAIPLTLILALSLLWSVGCGSEKAAPRATTTPIDTSPSGSATTQASNLKAAAVLEAGQSAQFPGIIVMLRRVVWKDDTLTSYWVLQNNGTKKIEYATVSEPIVLQFEAQDSNGNKGGLAFLSPEWDVAEQGADKWGLASTLWPGQTAVAFEEWKFGPLSKGMQVTVGYRYEEKLFSIKWDMGR